MSVLYFVGSAFSVLGGLAILLFAVLLGGIIGAGVGGGDAGVTGFFAGLGALIAIFATVFILGVGVVAALIGWGLWTGRSWARIGAIVLSGIFGVMALGQLAFGDFTAVVSLAVNGGIVWYLLQDEAKGWFAATPG